MTKTVNAGLTPEIRRVRHAAMAEKLRLSLMSAWRVTGNVEIFMLKSIPEHLKVTITSVLVARFMN